MLQEEAVVAQLLRFISKFWLGLTASPCIVQKLEDELAMSLRYGKGLRA